jgi:hypothetical protein
MCHAQASNLQAAAQQHPSHTCLQPAASPVAVSRTPRPAAASSPAGPPLRTAETAEAGTPMSRAKGLPLLPLLLLLPEASASLPPARTMPSCQGLQCQGFQLPARGDSRLQE